MGASTGPQGRESLAVVAEIESEGEMTPGLNPGPAPGLARSQSSTQVVCSLPLSLS